MVTFVLDIVLTEEQIRKLYDGRARSVVARSRDGRRVRFPLLALRPFVARDGVRGSFRLTVDGQRLAGIERVG